MDIGALRDPQTDGRCGESPSVHMTRGTVLDTANVRHVSEQPVDRRAGSQRKQCRPAQDQAPGCRPWSLARAGTLSLLAFGWVYIWLTLCSLLSGHFPFSGSCFLALRRLNSSNWKLQDTHACSAFHVTSVPVSTGNWRSAAGRQSQLQHRRPQ